MCKYVYIYTYIFAEGRIVEERKKVEEKWKNSFPYSLQMLLKSSERELLFNETVVPPTPKCS